MTPTLTATAATCPDCGCDLDTLHVRLFGRRCHGCRTGRQVAATARAYFERLLDSGDPAAIEEACGELESVLVRRGLYPCP